MIHLRRISQLVFFIVFLALFFLAEDKSGMNTLDENINFFFYIDPLIGLANILATHKIVFATLLSLITVIATLFFGRVFCGWVCPFGALNQFVGYLKKRKLKKPAPDIYSPIQKIKYLILIFFLAGTIFSVNQIGLLDPFSFFGRSFTLGVIPIVQFVTTRFFDLLFAINNDSVTNLAGNTLYVIKNNVFYFFTPHFSYTLLLTIIFLAIVFLNLYRSRYWCRVICPLGALLGLISHISFLRLKMNDKCTHCASCTHHCEGACNPHIKDGWIASECVMCLNCTTECPEKALSFVMGKRKATEPALDISRRRIISSGLLGILSVPLLRQQFWAKRVNPKLIRPPGAIPEPNFLAACIKCGNCMRACPTNFLQPTLLEAGVEGMFSPTGVGQKGYCEYNCTVCGQACPTKAITELSLTKKQTVKIGTACIDKSRCLTYAYNKPCIVCEEHCPTPIKAIWTEKVEIKDRNGKTILIAQPHVDPALCIGCSICENVCPVLDKPAIYVTSIGEVRSKTNRLLL